MYGVVLCAGRGTRMAPLTDRRPKPLLPVGDRSLVERVLDACLEVVDEFVLVTGFQGSDLEQTLGEQYQGVPITYVEQREQLGTAHAIGQARDVVDDRFLVLNGDVLIDPALPTALAERDGTGMAATPVENPSAYGVLTIEDGAVVDLVEKPAAPPTNLANVGCYAFEPDVFSYIDRTEKSDRGEYEITETIDRLLADGRTVSVVEYDGLWLDVGRPWELLEATEHVLSKLERRVDGSVEEGAQIRGPVVVEEGARIRSGAYLEGPVLVRSGADVGPNAYIRGSTVIGPDVSVGNAVEIKNSILMEGAAANHLSYVGDSVIGRNANLGAGTTVANLRHDDSSVRMTVKEEQTDTGRRKLGVVLGDDVKTGINTSLNAGVKLDTAARTAPGETVLRDRSSAE